MILKVDSNTEKPLEIRSFCDSDMKTPFLFLSCLAIAFGAVPKDRFNICAFIDCKATQGPPSQPPTQPPTTQSPTTQAPTTSSDESGNYELIKAQLVHLLRN